MCKNKRSYFASVSMHACFLYCILLCSWITRQERVLHNTSKQHTKSVFVQHARKQHARKQQARKQHAKNITRQYRVEHTFAVSTTRRKVRVVSTRLQHVNIYSAWKLLQD